MPELRSIKDWVHGFWYGQSWIDFISSKHDCLLLLCVSLSVKSFSVTLNNKLAAPSPPLWYTYQCTKYDMWKSHEQNFTFVIFYFLWTKLLCMEVVDIFLNQWNLTHQAVTHLLHTFSENQIDKFFFLWLNSTLHCSSGKFCMHGLLLGKRAAELQGRS